MVPVPHVEVIIHNVQPSWVFIYTMECYFTIRNEILLLATKWVDLEGIRLKETDQIQKGMYHMLSLLCGR